MDKRKVIIPKDYNLTIDNLNEVLPILRGDISAEIQKNITEEAGGQDRLNNNASSIQVDKYLIKGRDGKGLSLNEIARAVSSVDWRARIYYQRNKDVLKRAVNDGWTRILKVVNAHNYSGRTKRSYYLRGYNWSGTPRYSGRMANITDALHWIDTVDSDNIGVGIEGPQTPYRRKFIYLYANNKKSRERLKPRGSKDDKVYYDERAEFGSQKRLIKGRHRERYELYAYKSFMKVVSRSMRTKYRELVIGYRFVPSNEGLIPYKGKVWGDYLPRLYIGLPGEK
jgi:hypothetical protein